MTGDKLPDGKVTPALLPRKAIVFAGLSWSAEAAKELGLVFLMQSESVNSLSSSTGRGSFSATETLEFSLR